MLCVKQVKYVILKVGVGQDIRPEVSDAQLFQNFNSSTSDMLHIGDFCL